MTMDMKSRTVSGDDMYDMVMSIDIIVGRMECVRRIAETMSDIEDPGAFEYSACEDAIKFIMEECTRAKAEFEAERKAAYNPIMQ